MIANASITAWRRITGTTGDGQPVLDTVELRHAIACESIDPSDRRRSEAQHEGVELARVVRVRSAALRVAGITPAVGDRIALRTARPWLTTTDLDIVGVRALDRDSGVVELALGVRRDGL